MDVASNTLQKVPVTLTPVDNQTPPQPAVVDGIATFEVLSGLATVELDSSDPLGLSAFLVSENVAGSSQIRGSVDADLGSGVRTLEILFDYTYTSPEAANLGATVGTPVPK